MPLTIGIDLGTTFSAMAYVDEEGLAKIIQNAEGETTTPSVVLVEDGRFTVGKVAMHQWKMCEDKVVRWIKRAIGDADYRFQGHSAIEISAEIVKALKADAESYLGEPIDEAVITCPAYFTSLQIENTKAAGELAGLTVREIVKEPTAAAVFYGVENMQEGEKVLVCDLGGGTFDATVLALEKGVFQPVACGGDQDLGGHDWTMDLVHLAAKRLEETLNEDPLNDLTAYNSLYENADQAKRDYSQVPTATIACSYQGRLGQVEVSRDEFEAETEWRIGNLIMRVEQTLEKTTPAFTWDDIDHILLVGGSSRLRRVKEALAKASGKQPTMVQTPDLAVALGAAILAKGEVRMRRQGGGIAVRSAGSKGGLALVQYDRIIARSLGTRVVSQKADPPTIVNSLILPHSTKAPVSQSRDYEVLADGQEYVDIPVVEFENDDDFAVHRNYRCRYPQNVKRGHPITVTFHYDKSGIITAEAKDGESGKTLVMEPMPYEEPDIGKLPPGGKPRWIVFAVDVSGSMHGSPIANAKAGVIETAQQLLATGSENCQVGVVSFGSFASRVCDPTLDFTSLKSAVNGMAICGSTAMDRGIELAAEMLKSAPDGTSRQVVMVTDGMPDDSQATLQAAQTIQNDGITLANLGIAGSVDEAFLKQLAPNTMMIDEGSLGQMGDFFLTLLSEG